jgi:hypothetical protein
MKKSDVSHKTNPYAASPLRLPGFTPIVESDDDDSLMTSLPLCQFTMPWEQCLRHTMVIGKTGAGKTLRFMLRSIFAAIRNPEMSLVVIDAQRSEESRIIHYARKIRGKKARIIRLNWLDTASTHYWNCLDGITTRAEAFDLASSMCASMGHNISNDSLYFRQQATQLLAGIFRALSEEGRATLANARIVLESGYGEMRALAERSGIPELRRFSAELEAGNRNTETSVAEACNHLIALCDERAAITTSRSELQFQTLEDEPTILILSLDEEAVDRLRPLTNSFLHRLFGWIVNAGRASGGPLKRPLGIFIDEFASAVGRLPDFEKRAHTLRKRNVALFAAVQSADQITAEYRDSAPSVLAAFNHRIIIPPVADSDAHAASSLSGFIQTENVTTNPTGSALSITPSHRPLLLPQEIAYSEVHAELGPRITFFMAGTPPFQGWLKAAWEVPDEAVHLGPFSKSLLPKRRNPPDDGAAGMAIVPTVPDDPIPPGITNTVGWTDEAIERAYQKILPRLGWNDTTGSARKWWESFASENQQRKALVLRLAEELLTRNATITEFFLAYVYSNTDNIQANLFYLDYVRLKKAGEEEKRKTALASEADDDDPIPEPPAPLKTAKKTASRKRKCRVSRKKAETKNEEPIDPELAELLRSLEEMVADSDADDEN